VERILTIDFVATQALAEGTSPVINREEGQQPTFTRASQTMATTTTSLNLLSPTSTDWVDRMHCQLVEIHTIAVA
jgi:hypothetical protein